MSNGLRSARRALYGGSQAFVSKSRKEQTRTQKLGGVVGIVPELGLQAALSAVRSGKKALKLRLGSLKRSLIGRNVTSGDK